ncbi:MAG: hypothetical protein K2X99_01430 [Gemmatimonadaceae bacterium]|nr:hypothetical protein [Gemmatimonadaceae bacterium]
MIDPMIDAVALFRVSAAGGQRELLLRAPLPDAVERFGELASYLDPIVRLTLRCVRTGREWSGDPLPLAEVREALARLRAPLGAHGGVELSVASATEQLTLTPMLDLWAMAPSEKWVLLVAGSGAVEVEALPARSWALSDDAFGPAPDLIVALERAAERLTLRLA